MPVNKDLLLKLKEKVLSEPASFDMDTWKNNATKYLPLELVPTCKTVGCFAGWTCMIAKDALKDAIVFNWQGEATVLLDLSYHQGNYFFHAENWPRKFAAKYRALDYAIDDILEYKEENELTLVQLNNLKSLLQQRAEVGAKVIDYLILHDGNLYQENREEFPDMETIEV